MANTPDIDMILSTPLAPVDNNGFAERVVAEIAWRERSTMAIEPVAIFALAVVVALFIPLAGLFGPITTLAVELGLSLPFAAACAALVLSQSVVRMVSD
jgi:hypothetical protein